MKRNLLNFAFLCFLGNITVAQGNLYSTEKSLEVTHITNNKRLPDVKFQSELRNSSNWQNYLEENGTWYVVFNEENRKPHRAYGKPIAISGNSPEEKVENFIHEKLQGFDIPAENLTLSGVNKSDKHIFVNYYQTYDHLKVLGSKFTTRLTLDGKVILWGADVYNDINISTVPSLSITEAKSSATAGISEEINSNMVNPDLMVLPIPYFQSMKYKLVYQVNVETTSENGVPSNWYTLVDANSGDILYRQNEVLHCGSGSCSHENQIHNKEDFQNKIVASKFKNSMPPGDIEANITATVYPNDPSDAPTVVGLGNLNLTVGGNSYQTDTDGFISTFETGTQTVNMSLAGEWGIVINNSTTPSLTTTLTDGSLSSVSFDGDAMIEELCGYVNVNAIHDYHKTILPSFTGMDFQLPINVEISPAECNAFYNGSSINFYTSNATCLSYSQVADVVFHEYGHGINDKFYQDQGASFNNGAMGEGYADVWGYAEFEDPILGNGNDPNDPTAYIRRYDTLGKVYPIDIVGEVHADGEIIAGAWWDLYVLLGNDMPATMDLFALAYPGLQATNFNGNEGQAFTEVLLDVLMANDDDGDITNGTPNGNEIVEAFDMHGITLVSNAELLHTNLEEEMANTNIDIAATLSLNFPWTDYLNGVKCFYKLNNATTWDEVTLANTSGSIYEGQIPAQPEGTLVAYYLGAQDINNSLSSVLPIGAEADNPNLPYYILVDMDIIQQDDMGDFVTELGNWTEGLPTDNATTGQWELTTPLGSWGTPGDNSTMVAPDHQNTPGGEFCYVTQRGSSSNGAIGESDVDGGTTTLVSDVIDLSNYDNPVVTYYRWYVNNPPSGANPNADWWQVAISDDGGSSWTRVENTTVSDKSWRKKAFRIADYVNISDQFQIKFNVSDSIRPGLNLDGGSLIEAALDDMAIWDNVNDVSIDEQSIDYSIFPNPAQNSLYIKLKSTGTELANVRILDRTGRLVLSDAFQVNSSNLLMDLSKLGQGIYFVEVTQGELKQTKKFSKL